MTPSTDLEVPPEAKVHPKVRIETVVVEPYQLKPTCPRPFPVSRRHPQNGTFQSSMIEMNRMKSGSKGMNFFVSLLLNVTVLTVPVLAGLYFTDTINLKQFSSTFLIAPPPPPPPPPAPVVSAVKTSPARRVFESAGRLLAPTVIPHNIAQIKEAPLPDDGEIGGVVGGVPGGVAGGTMGGVIGGVIGGIRTTAAPVAPTDVKNHVPVRVGGRVRKPQLIRGAEPRYPPLALATHLEGTVVIAAVLDETGSVVEMHVLSGHPLLIDAALNAVKQWKYQPTYLNDQPVAVQMNITVTFQLSH